MIRFAMQTWADCSGNQQCPGLRGGRLTLSALQQTVVAGHLESAPVWKPVSKTMMQSCGGSGEKNPSGF